MFSIGQMGSVVLDAHNVSGVMWVFQVSGNLTTGADASVILKNGALASNVYWIVGGSASIGYATSMAGTILAQSSISIDAYARVDGRSLSLSTVLFASASSAKVPNGVSAVVYPSVAVELYLGYCVHFAVLAVTTVQFGSSLLTVIESGSVYLL